MKKNEDKATAEQINQKKIDLEEKVQPILDRAEVTKDLTIAVMNVENTLKENDALNPEEKKKIQNELQKLKEWLDKNPKATRKEADEKQQGLEEFINPIVKRAEVRKEVKGTVDELKKRIDEDKEMTKCLSETEKKVVNNKIAEVSDFLEKTKEPKVSELLKKNEELKETVEPILENAKARSNLENYAQSLKNKIKEDKNIAKDLTKDQFKELENSIEESLDLIKRSPPASEVFVQQKKLENTANPLLETAKNNMADRTKLENLAKNIQNQVQNVKQLKDLDENKRNAILSIAKNAEEWLRQNPNATEKDLQDYMKMVYRLLGDQTNFKFSVWVVSNYGLGYNFQEATKWGKQPDLKKQDKAHYYTSYLGVKGKAQKKEEIPSFGSSGEEPSYKVTQETKENPKIVVHAKSTQNEDWGKEIQKGSVSSARERFQKKLTKEEEEMEKKFAELKKKTGTKSADLKGLTVNK